MHELWIARHAETAWSRSGRHTGRTDIALTDEGRVRAERLRPLLADRDWSLVLCSPLGRAQETARLAGVEEAVQLRDDLLEVDYGEIEGVTTEAWRAEHDPSWSLWTHGAPGGERLDQVAERVDRVIAEALQADGDVLAVAHGHVLRILAARWLELGPEAGARLVLPTAGVGVLGFERDVRVLERWGL